MRLFVEEWAMRGAKKAYKFDEIQANKIFGNIWKQSSMYIIYVSPEKAVRC